MVTVPTAPSTWTAGYPITPKQLNQDLYTYTPGNAYTPNGINFHASRPIYVSSNVGSQACIHSSSAGAYSSLDTPNSGNSWTNWMDTAALWSAGADLPGDMATGHFVSTVPGASGTAGNAGGYYLMWGFIAGAHTTNGGGFGAAIGYIGSSTIAGSRQLSSTTRDNCAYVLDLLSPTSVNTILQSWCSDSSATTFSNVANPVDYSGETCRFYSMWCGVQSGGSVLGSVPAPQTSYTATTAITSAFMNGTSGIAGPLNFLNNPPLLRLANLDSTSITQNVVTAPALTGAAGPGPTVDTWSRFGTPNAGVYTVPVNGVYLVHGSVQYVANTGGNRQAGLQINGTLNLWGPGYQATGTGETAPAITRVLDLAAGDTVKLITQHNAGSAVNLDSTRSCRMVIVWLAALAPAGTNFNGTWTPPDTGFRWQAGTQVGQLPALFQQHLANDLNFLINKPYMLSYQSVQQSSTTWGTWNTITMDKLNGRVHGTTYDADNYNGWTSGASNKYVAPVAGWYLVVAGYNQTAPGASNLIAGINQSPAGNAAPDWFQHIRTTSGVYAAGAEAIGLYYLRQGDSVQPQYQPQDGAGTWTTFVGAGQESHFSVVWASE